MTDRTLNPRQKVERLRHQAASLKNTPEARRLLDEYADLLEQQTWPARQEDTP